MFHSYKYILKPYSYDFESSGIFNLGLDIGDYFLILQNHNFLVVFEFPCNQ